ncbi:MAG: SDR family oxidoreductase [Myxococcota bacterium]
MSQGECTFDFDRSRVLVTGGSNGIGKEIATAFRRFGARVVITGTRPSADDYDHDLSGFEYHSLQLTDSGAVDGLAEQLEALDVLVNNAGANLPDGRNEWEPDVFEECVTINLTSAFRLSVACKPLLVASEFAGGASVINLASMSSFFAVPIVPGYGAAKAGIVQMTKNLAVSWAGEGIRVNAVAPGLIESNMTAAMKGIEALERPQIGRTPMGRWGTPMDIAPPILFLASSSAGFVTGQTLNVDGGFSVF